MEISNILVVSPMYKEIQTLLLEKGIQKNFRYLSEDQVTKSDLEWADAFVAFNIKTEFDYRLVKWVHSLGAGVDSFLFHKEWPEQVLLTRTICSFGQRIAEYCLSYIIRDLQFHDQFQQDKEQKKWQPATPGLISEQKVMIFGTGEIGQTVAKTFAFLGAEVYGLSLSGIEKEYFTKVMSIDNYEGRASEMDYIINTLPLTENTVGLFNEKFFNAVSNVGFINVGRGASLDEDALLQALQMQQVRWAVLDVFTDEPLPKENKLWQHPKVWITPHISAVTTPSEGVDCFIETLKSIEGNQPLYNKVDSQKGY
ncbi:D-2-hydroxyacid dehydrogenase [Niallia endozanthoxylica]|uniref:D-2-hydroxyacid dehydrogenase n=1 Tax=Niallia endozanthoxylica TaxID=2036016 RepID=A0A5J5HZ57_9BACI|nr:D-2-hydroxyacid dehydrogenase [Niallia endozanthoxylica]KAA9028421.1 D-2-hydroxyacid dehydrogenase [Niallia endozanthoxylica]